MHHPFEWLLDWAEKEIKSLCLRHFNLVLTGHVHNKESFDINDGAACKTLIDSERRKNTQTSNDVRARQLVRF